MYYAKIAPLVTLTPFKKESSKCIKLKLPENYEPENNVVSNTIAVPLLTTFRYKKIKCGIKVKACYKLTQVNNNVPVTYYLTKYYCLYGSFRLNGWFVYRRCKIANLVAFWNDIFGTLAVVSNQLVLTPNDLIPASIVDFKQNEVKDVFAEDVVFDFNETVLLFISLSFRYANCHECFGDKSCSSASSSCSSSSTSFCSSSSSSDCDSYSSSHSSH